MNTLLKSVLPPNGFYCLTTIKTGAPHQSFYTDIDALVTAGLSASQAGRNAYYAMASFTDDTTRTQDNVLALKSFWLDVDCKNKDPEKDYANKADGIAAIQSFCNTHSFPRPTIVDSGNGWHVYWTLTDAVTKDEWQPVADTLKALCLHGGLRIDPACTADSARILRIPNTLNYRFDTPSEVTIMLQSSDVFFDSFKSLVEQEYKALGIKHIPAIQGAPTKKELSAATKALIENSTSSFKKILVRCAAGTGCAQLDYCVSNQTDLEEPMWRGALSVAHCCTDGAKAIHFISNQHPEYDPTYTEKKANETKGPYTCATFNGLRANVCTACPHWTKITSPIQLGKEIAQTQGPTVVQAVIQPPPPEPEKPKIFDMAVLDAALAAFHNDQLNVTIPVPPQPFFRGQVGGLYKRMKAEDGTFDDVLVYDDDFYAHARLYDPVDGQVLACRLHLPLDGIRNFNIPVQSIGAKDELRKILGKQGIAASDFTIKELSSYLIASSSELKHMQKEEKARTQMGWQEDGSFVVGNREYSKSGIRHCPPSNATMNYQHMFRMEGSMTQWRKLIDIYNAPGFEIHQFIFFLSLSSPVFKFIHQPGMLTAMISDESGVGKTTLSKVCNSVWGHPDEMMSMPHDTINATVNRMGVFNNISLFIDEFTNKSAEVCSDIVYMSTHGRGKERMSSSANVERINNTRWNLAAFVTANAALRDKLSSLKASTEGENMRLFEFDMRGTPVLDKEVADAIFPLMQDNYGVAGHIYASWLVQNTANLESMAKQVQRDLDKRFKFTNKERIWSASFGAAFAMAYVTKELGLHDFNINHTIAVMVEKMRSMREEVQSSVTLYDALLADFMTDHHSNILVIDGLADINGLKSPPKNKVSGKIFARYEPDTGKLYISATSMREYCTKRQFTYNSFIKLSGAVPVTCRLAANSGVVSAPSSALMFDTNAVGLDMTMWHDIKEEDAV